MQYYVRRHNCQLLRLCYTQLNPIRQQFKSTRSTQLNQRRSFFSMGSSILPSLMHLQQVSVRDCCRVHSLTDPSKLLHKNTEDSALLLKFTCTDAPSISADLFEILEACDAEVLDIDQLIVHENLCLYVLVRDKPRLDKPLVRTLLAYTEENNINLRLSIVNAKTLAENRMNRGKYTYTITLLKNQSVGFDVLSSVARSSAEAGFNIVRIERLSQLGAMLAKKSTLVAIEITLEHNSNSVSKARASAENLREDLMNIGSSLDCDMLLQRDGALRRAKRLVVMDMDSTIIQQEVIDELARCHGVYDKVAEVTERAMQGEMDFEIALRQRVRCLKGLPETAIDEVYENIKLTPGADYFIKCLQRMGYRTAVISGGFIEITERLRRKLELDYAFANSLEILDGKLTGELLGPIVCPARKRDLLESLAQAERISLNQTIAIGDGANDLMMIGRAGLGIAFNAKPVVQKEAKYSINQYRLDAVLFLLGFRPKDLPVSLNTTTI